MNDHTESMESKGVSAATTINHGSSNTADHRPVRNSSRPSSQRTRCKRYGPLALLTIAALWTGCWVNQWQWLWLIALAICAGCKWMTFCGTTSVFKSSRHATAYLLAWPGMNIKPWLTDGLQDHRQRMATYVGAMVRMSIGVALMCVAGWFIDDPLLCGWSGLIGYVLMLHFGLFDCLAVFWQRQGTSVEPIMNGPIASRTPGEFWRRWNTAFRDLADVYVFTPIKARCGARAGFAASFVVSGLVHDLVISIPAGAGYGGPTLYFVAQFAGILATRSQPIRRRLRAYPVASRAITAFVVLAPLPLLFHATFMAQVFAPFIRFLTGS